MKVVICIDDLPERYREFRRIMGCKDVHVIITCRKEEFEEYICYKVDNFEIIGICLDHDMPFNEGPYFVKRFLIDYNYPVAITSNNTEGAKNMQATLEHYETPCKLIPATTTNFGARLANYFLKTS